MQKLFLNRRYKLRRTGKTTHHHLVVDGPEDFLHPIRPGRVCNAEVQIETRVFREPFLQWEIGVRSTGVGKHMQQFSRSGLTLDAAKKLQAPTVLLHFLAFLIDLGPKFSQSVHQRAGANAQVGAHRCGGTAFFQLRIRPDGGVGRTRRDCFAAAQYQHATRGRQIKTHHIVQRTGNGFR